MEPEAKIVDSPQLELPTQPRLRVQRIRWMIRRDLPEVMTCESASFEFPWSLKDFQTVLKTRSCVGMVAELESQIVGFMVYDLRKKGINLLNIAVLPEFRRMGVGQQLIGKLKGKLCATPAKGRQARSAIATVVRESNLPAQLFFKANGFVCTEVIHDEYEDSDEDAYLFAYNLPIP